MPYDSEVTKLQGELQELEDEIDTVYTCIWWIENGIDVPDDDKIASLKRTINRLLDLKQDKEHKIRMHRQKIKESGVKF